MNTHPNSAPNMNQNPLHHHLTRSSRWLSLGCAGALLALTAPTHAVDLPSFSTVNVSLATAPGTDWQKADIAGASGTVTSVATMTSTLTTAGNLGAFAAIPSTAYANGVNIAYNSPTIFSTPAGPAASACRVAVVNKTGAAASSLTVNYTLSVPFNNTPGTESVRGYVVYYTTDALGTTGWTLVGNQVPDNDIFNTSTPISFTITPPGGWANDATLYVLWADDNLSGNDVCYAISSPSFTATPASQPLSVAITSPTSGTTVGANFTISASASVAPGTVDSVDFYMDDVLKGNDATSPYTWDVTGAATGGHTLKAVANGTGGPVTSSTVNITVGNLPPVVAVTSPAAGAVIAVGANVTLTATATDDGSVASVEFFVDNVSVGSDSSSPYNATWSNAALGFHAIKAVATDNASLTTTSTVVNVSVVANPGYGALSFDGADDHVTMGTALGLGAQSFTLECWVKHDPSGTGRTTASSGTGGVNIYPLIGKGRGEGDGSNVDCNYTFGLQADGRLAADFEDYNNGLNHPIIGTNVVPSNVWKHCAITYDGSYWRIYIDGVLDNSLQITGGGNIQVPRYDSIQHFGLGTAMTSTGAVQGFYKGLMDEVRVWNVARTQAEIAGTMYSEVAAATGLIGRWSLNETSGTTATNTGSSAINGTLTNGPLWTSGYPLLPAGNLAPTVAITSPANGATVFTNFTINASAADGDGTITSVAFYDGVTLLNTDSTSPYSYTWNGASAGSHALTAVALDNGGLSTTSAVVNVTVSTNVAPAAPVTVSPSSGATGVSTSPTLTVSVSDPNADPMAVTFYGRANSVAAPGPDFTVVALPDSQFYSSSYPATFQAQTSWVVNNRVARNIVYLTGEGDVVNTASTAEYDVATAAYAILENPVTTGLPQGIPFGVPVGNHDSPPYSLFNTYFNATRFSGRSYYGGSYGTGYQNHYDLFSASGMDFIVLSLEYNAGADAGIMAWANGILAANSNRRAIVVTHELLSAGSAWPAVAGWSGGGQTLFNALSAKPNVFLMLCGHNHGTGRRHEAGGSGFIDVLLADYQSFANGGDGYLRTMEFSPANNVIRVKTYSPTAAASLTDGDNQFTLSYTMAATPPAFTVIGTNTNVASGTPTSVSWAGLTAGTTYEWYAVASDASLSTTGTTNTFTTAGVAPQPPTVAITSPANGATVGTSFTIAATAADSDGTITSVTFYDGATLLNTDTSSPYSYAWTGASVGSHSLTAVALDNSGLTTTSAVVNVTVAAANVAPTVAITSPANGASVGTSFTIAATAADSDGTITSVTFYDGATLLNTDSSSPYSYAWSGASVGSHALTAVALDNGGLTTTSAVVNVTVAAAPNYRSYTGAAIAENFNGLGTGGTSVTALTGWDAGHFSTNPQQGTTGGTGLITVTDPLVVDDGSHDPNGTPMLANFGTTGAADRALGSFARTTPAGDQYLQLAIKNDTASPIASFTLSYRGEEWRSSNAAVQQLTVWYSNTDATNGFVAMGSGFNFSSPNITGSNVAIDGNAAGNFTAISGTYTPAIPIAPGSTFYIRWYDINDNGIADDFFAIDDVTVTPAASAPAQYVILISVDGLGGTYLGKMFDGTATGGPYAIPNFTRLKNQGAGTLAAHNDNNNYETLPNHTSIMTARPRDNSPGFAGHNWTLNSDPAVGQTIHSVKGSYVASGFDVAHDNGLRTGMYANKSKFSLFDTYGSYTGGGSYNATYGALDTTGVDNGRDKIDNTYIDTTLGGIVVDTFIAQETNPATRNQYAFVHINEPDAAGHGSGWGTAPWYASVVTVDGMLGKIFKLIETDVPAMTGKTTIILTADHGFQGAPGADTYQVPFYVWGAGVTAGADLYTLNAGKRQVASTYPMTTYSGIQPVRNAEASNLALNLLGLGPIPGSSFDFAQDLVVKASGNVAPTVAITSPANGASVGTSFTIAATAADSDGTITSVAFYDGATLLNTDTVTPYSYAWSGASAGSHALTAKATDNGGLTTTSAVVNVTVAGSPGTTAYEPFESYANGTLLSAVSGWWTQGAYTVISGGGVNGSAGIGTDGGSFILNWQGQPFQWSTLAAGTKVAMTMDFQTSASGNKFDDDRVGWTVDAASNTTSANQLALQLDVAGMECYWDSNRTVLNPLSGIKFSTWYRFNVEYTKLTATSAGIVGTLTELDASGNPIGTPYVGTIADSSAAPYSAPAGRFTSTYQWPSFKNYSATGGNADNARFTITPPVITLLGESFDSMGSAGTTTPTGWTTGYLGTVGTQNRLAMSPYAGDGQLITAMTPVVSDGSALPTPDVGTVLNLGTTGSSDRALGNYPRTNPSGDQIMQVAIVNTTGGPLTSINVSYTGEQWRQSQGTSSSGLEMLRVLASTTSSTTGFTYYPSLDFTAPKQGAANIALDGNLAANRAVITATITLPSAVPNGGTFYLRWHDWNDNSTTDHFLGIDDVVIRTAAASNQAPTVAITSPANNATVGTSFTIDATAADSDGTIASVAFYDGATLLNTDTVSPYSYAWSGASVGGHVLTAVALDNGGLTTTSAVVNVTVTAGGTGFTAYNDFVTSYTANANVTHWGQPQVGTPQILKDEATGATVTPTMTLTSLNTVDNGGGPGAEIGAATPVGQIFNGKVAGQGNVIYYGTAGNWWFNVEFAGLDNNKTYEVATFTDRGNSAYDNLRWTLISLVGADSSTDASSAGGANYSVSSTQVSQDSYNTADGSVVKWTGIKPGVDGKFSVNYTFATDAQIPAAYTATNTEGYGYAPAGIMLRETTPANQPPTVAITSPTTGATVSTNFTIDATAADSDGTIISVAFYDGATLLNTDTVSPYSYAWSGASVGSHSLTAVALDNGGLTTTSAAVNVTVAVPNVAPTVAITSPANNVGVGTGFTINATAADSDGTITGVAFYDGATLLNTDTVSPYSFAWSGASAGSHALTAKATDNGGLTTTSAVVNVTVVAATTPRSFTGAPIAENFDGLGISGTVLTPLVGWDAGQFNPTQPNQPGPGNDIATVTDTSVVVDDGAIFLANNTASIGNLGTTGSSDRALGGMPKTASGDLYHQLAIKNDSGSPIMSFALRYTGEQWASAPATNPDSLTVWFSDNNFLGGFVTMGSAFTFTAPQVNLNTKLDGNAAANRAVISGTFTPTIPIAPGNTFYIRWYDRNDPAQDHVLAIDDLTVTPVTPPTVTLGLAGSPMVEAGGMAAVTATLSAAYSLPVTVNLAFAGTATLTTDYTRSATSIVIAAGSTSGSIILTAVQDTVYDPNETIIVDISSVVNGSENGTQQVTAIIADDEPVPSFTAYNDCSSSASTPANTTQYRGNGTTSGLLKDFATGTILPVTLAITANAVSYDGTGGPLPAAGTDAYDTFNGKVVFDDVIWYTAAFNGFWMDATCTGLDPNKEYEFATSVNRGGSGGDYASRFSKFTISGHDSATQSSTTGVTVNSPDSVTFCSGINTVGYVARWTKIRCGADGTFKVRVEDGGGVGKGYAFDGLMLRETDTPFTSWMAGYPTLSGPDAQPGANPDGDNKINLQEYAFGTNPTVSFNGPITYAGGVVTGRGDPTTSVTNILNGVDFRAVFGRRRDYVAAGLTYTVQFSAGLDIWVNSPDIPTVLATDGVIDAVSVPYPLFIPTARGMEKPQFFRVAVTGY
ncbi:MAG: Ig-like domain-containing protein [Verrucomicrobia bacterium]|nr:Ig-like domain-containing protein [Verrucomicrobiota bacterium]